MNVNLNGRDIMKLLSSINCGELLEYTNDIAYQEGLPSLELFAYLVIYLLYIIIADFSVGRAD